MVGEAGLPTKMPCPLEIEAGNGSCAALWTSPWTFVKLFSGIEVEQKPLPFSQRETGRIKVAASSPKTKNAIDVCSGSKAE